MAKFRAICRGGRGEASRCGHSEAYACVESWKDSVQVYVHRTKEGHEFIVDYEFPAGHVVLGSLNMSNDRATWQPHPKFKNATLASQCEPRPARRRTSSQTWQRVHMAAPDAVGDSGPNYRTACGHTKAEPYIKFGPYGLLRYNSERRSDDPPVCLHCLRAALKQDAQGRA